MAKTKATKPTLPAPTAIVNVMARAGLIVVAFATFADARDVSNEANKGAWLTAATQFRDAGKKQGEALRKTSIAEALKAWGDSRQGRVKTLTTAVNIAARAVKLGVPLFDGDKVVSREKVRTAVAIAERVEAGAAAGEAPAAVAGDVKGGEVNILTPDNVRNVLHYLETPEQAAPFAPDILKAAEAAGLRIMTSAEQTALTAYYLQSQKAA